MWEIIKRFLIAWLVVFVFLVICSCVRYREFIAAAFSDQMWELFNAVMPIIIIIFVFAYIIKTIFR